MVETSCPRTVDGDGLQRYRAIFESAVDFAIIATDCDGLITDWNRGAEAIFGWSAEEMIGESAERFFTPEDRAGGRIAHEMRSALLDGRGNDERWHLRKDGARFWANGEMTPLRDGAGAHLGFLKIVRDETEKHAAAEKQRADREFMHGVLAASNDCIKVLDLDGNLTFMSEGGQRTMEVSDFNEIRGCPWPDFWRGSGRADAEAALEAARAGGVGRFQGPADTVAGSPRHWDVQVTPILGVDGQPERLLSISRDVTATWQAQATLRQSQDQLAFERNLLQAVFHQAPVGISVAGADPHAPNTVNARAEAMLGHGLGPADLSRYQDYGAVHPDGRPYAGAEYPSMRAFHQGEVVRAEDMLYRHGATGELRLFEVSSSPVRDGAGRIQAAATVFADITDRRRAERQLRRLALVVEQSSDFIGIADADGRVEYVNPAGRALVGLPDEAAARASRVVDYFLSEDLPFVEASIMPPVLAGDNWSGDFRFRDFATGAPVPVRYNQFSLKNERGEFEGYAAVSHDISARKAAEAQRDVLHRELAHRLKNTLAMVQAIVTQTLRSTPDVAAARDALAARLFALGKAHDLLITGQREGADMRLLIEDALKLHDDGRPGRFFIDGPPVFCGDRSALSLVLMMHELATNAAKYGALSAPAGSVAIAWTLDGDAAAPDLRLTWREHGGPPVAAPTRQGFGSRLIERGLAGTVGGDVSLSYLPSGVTCTLVAPLSGFAG